ncbi:MAG: hypothetical protein KAR16_03070 [Bacteroidales bacterium]|nr:hypothetical protein [Bacteroidales bacterium]
MENQYMCPHCRGYLKVGDCIVFKIRNTRREKGLLMMHQEGDNYSGVKHPLFYSEEGERIDFFCPICMQSLDASLDENLVQVIMIDSSGYEQKIYFSRIAGEHSTYQVSSIDLIQYLDI